MSSVKRWLALFALSFGYASMFVVPYAKYVFYDPMMKALNCTNMQLGSMVSLYVAIGIFTFVPGGWVADRFSAKKILTISLVAQAIATTWFALAMSLSVGWIVWIIFAFTNCFAYWAACLKGVRMLGDAGDQGKLYGFFESGVGLSNVIISFVALGIFSRYVDQVEGFKVVTLVYAGFGFLAALITWFLYDEYMTESEADKAKVGMQEVLLALKNPAVWLISIIILTTYGLYVGQTYLTPYLTAVVGVTVTFSGALAIIRTHGLKLFASPIGGAVADKWKSPATVLIIGYVLITLLLIVFLNLPSKPTIGIVMVLMLLVAFVGSAMKGIMWSTVEESKIPRHYTGIAIGMASIIGYLPDVFMGPLFGYWLDVYGNPGYNFMFAFLIGTSILGLIAAVGILKVKKSVPVAEIKEGLNC